MLASQSLKIYFCLIRERNNSKYWITLEITRSNANGFIFWNLGGIKNPEGCNLYVHANYTLDRLTTYIFKAKYYRIHKHSTSDVLANYSDYVTSNNKVASTTSGYTRPECWKKKRWPSKAGFFDPFRDTVLCKIPMWENDIRIYKK